MAPQKFISLLILFFSACSLSQAQSKTIIRSYPFYFITTPEDFPKGGGNDIILVRPDSANHQNNTGIRTPRQKDTSIIIYIETNTKDIIWDGALIGNQFFHITVLPQQGQSMIPGFLRSGKQVTLSRAKKNHFFLLQLSRSKNKSPLQKINVFHTIMLKGKYKGKAFNYKTGSPKEIMPLPAS
jgi:hypothetical protein